MSSGQAPFEEEHKQLQETDNAEKEADNAITKMKSHLDEISKLMENIQINTNSIDDEVTECEKFIVSTFDQISAALEKRKESLINELQKTAKNKKLSLLIQHNELNNKYQESQNELTKHEESAQNQENNNNDNDNDNDDDDDNTDNKQENDDYNKIDINLLNNINTTKQNIASTNFDLHFNSNHSKQLIQMINHFGSISANPIPNLLSLKNNGKNFVIAVQWKLPSNGSKIDHSKIQKIRIEWSDTITLKWNHKEFIISDEDKKENQRENGRINLINVGKNGTFIFRICHYYLTKWSKMSATKSISITGIYSDFWDNIYHGDNISVEGRCIVKKLKTGYQSAFLSNICSDSNIHRWKFKIEGGHKIGSTRIFGIWRVDAIDDEKINIDINKIINTYFTNEKLIDPNSDQTFGKPFGDKCHEGDEIDMFLDLNKLKLFYKLNNILYGKPIDIARANYRAVVSFYCVDDRIKLLEYRKNSQI